MPIDRDAARRTADRLSRQGRTDGAGNLSAQPGDPERAVDQFVRSADRLAADGLLARAVAQSLEGDDVPVHLRQRAQERRSRNDVRGEAAGDGLNDGPGDAERQPNFTESPSSIPGSLAS